MSPRLRKTCHAGAQARLAPLGLDLDRPDDPAAAEVVSGARPLRLIPDHGRHGRGPRSSGGRRRAAAVRARTGPGRDDERPVCRGGRLQLVGAIVDELERAVIGKRAVLELIVLGLIADGHVLLDDLPGWRRDSSPVRWPRSPADVLPHPVHARPAAADITGATVFDGAAGFTFRPGPSSVSCAGRRDEPGAGEDAGRAARGHAGAAGHGGRPTHPLPGRSWWWPPRTRSRTRAPSLPRRSSTVSCCAPGSAIRARRRGRSASASAERGTDEVAL